MREIKFRAWIVKIGDWADFVEIHSGGGFRAYKGDVFYHNAFIEQYTGLKDADGREIYEGDITEGSEGLTVIRSLEDVFAWISESTYHPSTEKIVGNIDQNPELLEAR